MRLVDLSQPFNMHTPGWIDYPSPKISYFQHHATNGIVSQYLETPLHISTHMDSEMHGYSGGKDVASIPLERLVHEGVIVDLSDEMRDWSIIEPEQVTRRMDVKQGDILILHTGWHRFYTGSADEDEIRYFCKHPGPSIRFARWAIEKQLAWIGVDCGSGDHPMNTSIRTKKPDITEEYRRARGHDPEEDFPRETLFIMHREVFRHGITHVENIGGDIDQALNRRCTIGCFPWRFEGGEASPARVVAFLEE